MRNESTWELGYCDTAGSLPVCLPSIFLLVSHLSPAPCGAFFWVGVETVISSLINTAEKWVLPPRETGISEATTGFQKAAKASALGYDHPGLCEALGNLGPPRAPRARQRNCH